MPKLPLQQQRIQELDALRGFAVLMVAAFHYYARYDQIYKHSFEHADWFYAGRMGVQLFFIISGFVNFMTVEQVKGAGDFLYRRFTRLYPTYWICLIITFGLVSWWGLAGREVSANVALWNLSMVHELWGLQHVDGVYWSLLPELLFYALMALLLLIRQHQKIWLISSLWTLLIWGQLQYDWFGPAPAKLLNLHYGLFFIAGIHFYHLFKRRRHFAHHLFILLALLLSFRLYNDSTDRLWLFSFFLIFYLTIYGQMRWIKWRPLLWLGQISYAFYLLHQNIGYLILNELKSAWGATAWWMVFIPLPLVLLLAHLVTVYLERPIIKKLRSLFRRESRL